MKTSQNIIAIQMAAALLMPLGLFAQQKSASNGMTQEQLELKALGVVELTPQDAAFVGHKIQLGENKGKSIIYYWSGVESYPCWLQHFTSGNYRVELKYSLVGANNSKVAITVGGKTFPPVELEPTGTWDKFKNVLLCVVDFSREEKVEVVFRGIDKGKNTCFCNIQTIWFCPPNAPSMLTPPAPPKVDDKGKAVAPSIKTTAL